MNLRFIGDTQDHWKGSMIETLQRGDLMAGLMVDAMATDPAVWEEEDWQLYSELLRVPRRRIVSHNALLSVDRGGYFREIPEGVDLFLDPDTGVATGKVQKRDQYIYPKELAGLLTLSRVVAAYQHGGRSQIRPRLCTVVDAVGTQVPSLACVAYAATSVAMLFFSKDPDRIQPIADAFRALLGRHASDRILLW